jgi:hypothetical protein
MDSAPYTIRPPVVAIMTELGALLRFEMMEAPRHKAEMVASMMSQDLPSTMDLHEFFTNKFARRLQSSEHPSGHQ